LIANFSVPITQALDVRRLRGLLAEHRITQTRLAEVSGLSPRYVSRILRGAIPAGELANIKLGRGIRQLGLESELSHASYACNSHQRYQEPLHRLAHRAHLSAGP
jgi:Helix-turn-helix